MHFLRIFFNSIDRNTLIVKYHSKSTYKSQIPSFNPIKTIFLIIFATRVSETKQRKTEMFYIWKICQALQAENQNVLESFVTYKCNNS